MRGYAICQVPGARCQVTGYARVAPIYKLAPHAHGRQTFFHSRPCFATEYHHAFPGRFGRGRVGGGGRHRHRTHGRRCGTRSGDFGIRCSNRRRGRPGTGPEGSPLVKSPMATQSRPPGRDRRQSRGPDARSGARRVYSRGDRSTVPMAGLKVLSLAGVVVTRTVVCVVCLCAPLGG